MAFDVAIINIYGVTMWKVYEIGHQHFVASLSFRQLYSLAETLLFSLTFITSSMLRAQLQVIERQRRTKCSILSEKCQI